MTGMCTSSPFCSPIEPVKMTLPNSHRSSWCLAVHPCYPSRWKSGQSPATLTHFLTKSGMHPLILMRNSVSWWRPGEGSGNAEHWQSARAAKEVVRWKAQATKIQGKERRQTGGGVVSSLYPQQGVSEGSLQAPKRRRYCAEDIILKTAQGWRATIIRYSDTQTRTLFKHAF